MARCALAAIAVFLLWVIGQVLVGEPALPPVERLDPPAYVVVEPNP